MSALDTILNDGLTRVNDAQDGAALEQVRLDWLGKKGLVTEQMKQLAGLDADAKKAFGAQINRVKEALQAALHEKKMVLDAALLAAR
jgi:phenylalanyl-tRNA synthetase alpha chain